MLLQVFQEIFEQHVAVTARANRSRPHHSFGSVSCDYYREVNGDVGWRGPAELLKISRDEGTAIIAYQGCPYLVSLRHIRPHQAGVFVTLTKVQEGNFIARREDIALQGDDRGLVGGTEGWPHHVATFGVGMIS